MTNVSLITIGEKLKAAREKKTLAVDQVQKQTHIHSSVIAALEEGRCDEILTPTYVKSFLKKYSQYLGLDSREILKDYSILHGDDTIHKPLSSYGPTKDGERLVPKVVYALTLIVIAALVISMMIFMGKRLTDSLNAVRRSKNTASRTEKKPPSPQARLEAKPRAKPQSVQPPKSAPSVKGPFTLTLKIRQPVRVMLKKDGDLLFDRVLPKGASESFTANDKIEIYVARAEMVEFVLNGKAYGSPGKGVIKNIEITKNGIKIK